MSNEELNEQKEYIKKILSKFNYEELEILLMKQIKTNLDIKKQLISQESGE